MADPDSFQVEWYDEDMHESMKALREKTLEVQLAKAKEIDHLLYEEDVNMAALHGMTVSNYRRLFAPQERYDDRVADIIIKYLDEEAALSMHQLSECRVGQYLYDDDEWNETVHGYTSGSTEDYDSDDFPDTITPTQIIEDNE